MHFVEHGLRGSGMGHFCWRIMGLEWALGGGPDDLSTLRVYGLSGPRELGSRGGK
jgi:hypothetical protein